MAEVRVGSLDLKLVAPEAMRAEAPDLIRRTETGFVPDVLRAMERRLRRVYGRDAIIRIRWLRIKCSMRPSALDTASFAESLGEDLAAQVEEMVAREKGSGLRPTPSASVQVFRDAAHQQAVSLIAAAERRKGPSGTREDFARLWTAAVRTRPAVLRTILERCAEAKGLETVLAHLDTPSLEALVTAKADDNSTFVAAAISRALGEARRHAAPPAAPDPPADTQEPPATTPVDAPSAADQPTEEVSRVDAAAPDNPTERHGWQEKARDPVSEAKLDDKAAPRAEPLHDTEGIPPAGDGRTETEQRLSGTGGIPRGGAAGAPTPEAPPSEPAGPETGVSTPFPSFASAWCGLLYLVNVSQRLELPERLWQIGVDEGAVLAAIFTRLSGAPGDPAVTLFAQTFPDAPPLPEPLPDWARAELTEGALTAAARLLAATTAEGALRDRVATLEAWFGDGAGFDLAAWGAALHLAVAEAMLGETLPPGALRDRFARDGHIELGEDVIRVVQPLDAIDIDMRRAGLDADPGWLAWLEKRLVFVFADPDGEGV